MPTRIAVWLALALCLMSCDPSSQNPRTDSGHTIRRALIIVDMQNDFMPGGALPTAGGDQITGLLNALQSRFDVVVATQDWHPRGHGSFASSHPGRSPGDVIDLNGLQQVLWPDHAIQDSAGAELVTALDQKHIARIFRKGTEPLVDSYSGFFDNGQRGDTGLGDYLRSQGVSAVYVAGLALDYCVKYTALDAQRIGFDTTLIVDASRAVNLHPGDGANAVATMKAAGVRVVQASELLTPAASAVD